MISLEDTEILTDFDRAMVKEQTPYVEAILYLSHCLNIKKILELAKDFAEYKTKRDARYFYSFFKDCPVQILDKIVNSLHINKNWEKIIEEEGIKKVGIVSRDNQKIILEFLKEYHPKDFCVDLTLANNPEIKNGIYTGNVELRVELKNLIKILQGKPYIYGKEERKALEDAGMYCKNKKGDIYICEKTKLF